MLQGCYVACPVLTLGYRGHSVRGFDIVASTLEKAEACISEAWLPQVNVLRDGAWIVDGSPHCGSSLQLAADIT